MTFTPTKWTQHFGDLAGYGAAVLVLGRSRRAAHGRPPRWPRRWPRRRRSWWRRLQPLAVRVELVRPDLLTLPPQVAGHPAGDDRPACWWRVAGGRRGRRWLRDGWTPLPRAAGRRLVAGRAVACWRCRCWSFARVAVAHRDSYTLASDALATLRGDPCGLQRTAVRRDRPRGRAAAGTGGVPVDVGGGPRCPASRSTSRSPRAGSRSRAATWSSSRRSARCGPATTCGSTSAPRPAGSPRQATRG